MCLRVHLLGWLEGRSKGRPVGIPSSSHAPRVNASEWIPTALKAETWPSKPALEFIAGCSSCSLAFHKHRPCFPKRTWEISRPQPVRCSVKQDTRGKTTRGPAVLEADSLGFNQRRFARKSCVSIINAMGQRHPNGQVAVARLSGMSMFMLPDRELAWQASKKRSSSSVPAPRNGHRAQNKDAATNLRWPPLKHTKQDMFLCQKTPVSRFSGAGHRKD